MLLYPQCRVDVFEGGLTLKFRELDAIGSVVIRLISVGALMTWG